MSFRSALHTEMSRYYQARIETVSVRVLEVPLGSNGKPLNYVRCQYGNSVVTVSRDPTMSIAPGDVLKAETRGTPSAAFYVAQGVESGDRPPVGYYEFNQPYTGPGGSYDPGDHVFGRIDGYGTQMHYQLSSGYMFYRQANAGNNGYDVYGWDAPNGSRYIGKATWNAGTASWDPVGPNVLVAAAGVSFRIGDSVKAGINADGSARFGDLAASHLYIDPVSGTLKLRYGATDAVELNSVGDVIAKRLTLEQGEVGADYAIRWLDAAEEIASLRSYTKNTPAYRELSVTQKGHSLEFQTSNIRLTANNYAGDKYAGILLSASTLGSSISYTADRHNFAGSIKQSTALGAHVTYSNDQSSTNAQWSYLAFDTETGGNCFDTDGCHDNSTYNSRLTCKTAGVYEVRLNVSFATGGGTSRGIAVLMNAAGTYDPAKVVGSCYLPLTGALTMSLSPAHITMTENDHIEAFVFQDSGGFLAVKKLGMYSPEFSMVRVA